MSGTGVGHGPARTRRHVANITMPTRICAHLFSGHELDKEPTKLRFSRQKRAKSDGLRSRRSVVRIHWGALILIGNLSAAEVAAFSAARIADRHAKAGPW